jgi:two-component system sensor histidine kinase VicK
MDLSRIDSGMIELDMQTCNISFIVRHIAESFGAELHAKQLTLELDLPESPVITVTDRDRLYQVLSNLMSNACKYNRDGGKVSVRMAIARNELTIMVADNGIGIPEDEQMHVFSRFFRSSSSRLLSVKGTGLGLAITRSLVERLGGKIWFESVPDGGSRFGFSLPLVDGASTEATSAAWQ